MLDKLILLLEIIVAAYCAYMYSEQYTKAGQVFNGLYTWLEAKLSPQSRFWYDHCRSKFRYLNPELIFKPLIGCFKCVCAQWAMWTYLFNVVTSPALDFNLSHLFACACVGTGIGMITHKILNDEPTA